jgi:antitoxin component YwqK of YwqJK toxin-antitoxin module
VVTLLPREETFASTLKPCTGPVEQYNNCSAASTSSDGFKYTGEWRNGLPEGSGELLFPDGYRYVGTFSRGKRNGLFVARYPSGEKHVGMYIEDKPEGVVILYNRDGTTSTVVVYSNGLENSNETNTLREQLQEALGAAKLSDFETALDIWLPLAEAGNAEAQYQIAIMNEHGEGIPENKIAAQNWMKRAAEQHHPKAQQILGNYLFHGTAGEVDKQQSYAWMLAAAENGVIQAQRETAMNLLDGEGVKKDQRRAIYWFSVAALNSDLYSALELGNQFAGGKLTKRNDLRAYQWYYIASGYQGPNYKNVEFKDRYASPLAEKELERLAKKLKKSDVDKAKQLTDHCLLEESMDAAFKTCGLDIFR